MNQELNKSSARTRMMKKLRKTRSIYEDFLENLFQFHFPEDFACFSL